MSDAGFFMWHADVWKITRKDMLNDLEENKSRITASEIRITVLGDEKDGEKAVNACHEAFGLAE